VSTIPSDPADSSPAFPDSTADSVSRLPAPPRERIWLHALLFLLTVLTTSLVGGLHYAAFLADFRADAPLGSLDFVSLVRNGLWYSLSILAILGCHEMGHYVACRRYGVDASLPYFLPAPLPLTGTLGAFIRIRSRIPSKVALFDIGIAGPIAGFIVALPILFIGLSLSRVIPLPADFTGFELGEPLLFRAASFLIFGDVPDGQSVNLHPMAFAAWFGLLATALNLFPIGQLDGGHVAYAVLGRRSTWLTIGMLIVAIGLAAMSSSWWVWTGLLVLMIFLMGPHHPPTLDDQHPLDPIRLALAAFAVVMLILCFTPAPIEPFVTGM
jgi:membrane-associated protease RseP (regulator of RpoE activity)